MNAEEASLIVRLMNAVSNEGLGPDPAKDGDDGLIDQAVQLAGSEGYGSEDGGVPWWAEGERLTAYGLSQAEAEL